MKLRRENSQSLGDVIQQYVEKMKLTPGLYEVRAAAAWEKVLGKSISKHTTRIKLKESSLYVQLDSSVIRNELHYAQNEIVSRLNEELGSKIIDTLKLK